MLNSVQSPYHTIKARIYSQSEGVYFWPRMTRFSLLIILSLAGSSVSLSKFYTETKIVGEGEEQQRCSEVVFERRSSASPTSGVESTVGLGAALLIFIGVGVFAVGIAQAFQMESYFVNISPVLTA